ncbi:hypothetical protein BDA96_01G542500 [Sorghum bicolor]|uniref:Uncharacterized protein n=2 Tax=Sorghum bicolor TaxID=4558 RepID=A0A1Z5SBD6_SORBI|nr:hypothetical protein BDA96_01G542500 [Sorghum bicolor]OQU93254.1 hypothetical protein SORBI_3001G507966 [Sorghum bicolor]
MIQNMNDRHRVVWCMMITLFLAASSTTVLSGRPNLLKVRSARIRSNATTLDESKVNLIFCKRKYCEMKPTTHDCYCCLATPTQVCYLTEPECRAKCLHCNPICPT